LNVSIRFIRRSDFDTRYPKQSVLGALMKFLLD